MITFQHLGSGTSWRNLLQDESFCVRCQRRLDRSAYVIGGAPRCLRCALRYRPLLRRSGLTALVVGTILVAINQGNLLLAGAAPMDLLWKMPLTYAVPFCVATWGALGNSRQQITGDRR